MACWRFHFRWRSSSRTASSVASTATRGLGRCSTALITPPLSKSRRIHSACLGLGVLLLAVPAQAQDGHTKLNGTVVDTTYRPVPHVTLRINGGAVTVADDSGQF